VNRIAQKVPLNCLILWPQRLSPSQQKTLAQRALQGAEDVVSWVALRGPPHAAWLRCAEADPSLGTGAAKITYR